MFLTNGVSMQCNCGGETKQLNHVITKSQSKIDWMGIDYDFPVRIERDLCKSCGRHDARFFDDTTNIRLNIKKN